MALASPDRFLYLAINYLVVGEKGPSIDLCSWGNMLTVFKNPQLLHENLDAKCRPKEGPLHLPLATKWRIENGRVHLQRAMLIPAVFSNPHCEADFIIAFSESGAFIESTNVEVNYPDGFINEEYPHRRAVVVS